MTFGSIAVGIGLTVAAGASIYGTVEQGNVANQQLGLARTTQSEQMTAFQQLQALITNPGAFFSSPTFTSALKVGTESVAHQGAASFGPNSTNEAAALQAYGQSFGAGQLLSQEQLLATMSGTTNAASPAQAGGVASSAAGSAASALGGLGGLLAFFGGKGSGTPPASPFYAGAGPDAGPLAGA